MTDFSSNQKINLLKVITPALLIIVASVQIYLTSTTSLTAWKGGGFGMFSTIFQRKAKHWIHTNSGTFYTFELAELAPFYANSQAMPNKKHLKELGHAFNNQARLEGKPYISVAVVVCDLTYDQETSTVQLVPLEVEDGTSFYLVSRDGKELKSAADE